jgi:hypothetical protein
MIIFMSVIIGVIIWVFLRERKNRIIFEKAFIEVHGELLKHALAKQQALGKMNECPKEMVTVGRWMCMQCRHAYVLDYYKHVYVESADKLDIIGSHKSFECFKCGSNLMRLCFMEVDKGSLIKTE